MGNFEVNILPPVFVFLRMDRVESSLNTRQKKLVVKVPKIKQLPNAGRGAITVPIKMV